MKDYNAIIEIVTEAGGKIESGINWAWAKFEEEEAARAFEAAIVDSGWETRGVYPPFRGDGWGVRFR